MIDIALWGYGWFGKGSLHDLERCCADTYRVVRVYDRNPNVQGTQAGQVAAPIADPSTIVEDFKAGLFEQVMVCLRYATESEPIKQFLADNNIPELYLGSLDDFYPAETFEHHPGSLTIDQEGYKYWAFTDMCGAVPNFGREEVMFLFDRQGRVLAEHWDAHDFNAESSGVRAFPFPLDSLKVEHVRMEGSWCILAKKYSANYWHFTFESMDCVTLLEEAGFTGRYVIPSIGFAEELMQLAGVSPDRVVRLDQFEEHIVYEFDEVCYPKLPGPSSERLRYSAPVLKRLGEKIQGKLPVDPSMPKRLFVKRIGKRRLLGADDIVREYGFETMVPEDYSVAEQAALFYNADIVLCVHGANSTNCLYMREGSVFVEAFSGRWLQECNIDATLEKGVRYLPVCDLRVVFSYSDGIRKDYTIYERLLRETIENAITIFEHPRA